MILATAMAPAQFFTPETITRAIRVIVLVALGLPLAHFLSLLGEKITRKRFSEQTVMLVRKTILYTGVVLVATLALLDMGFKIGPLLGAAGVVGIAVGFASQTSVSNIISGLFLVSEKPFSVGDVIKVGETKGIVLSIDLLSVKLRTFDNQFVRIPNENLVKNEFTNVTRFPIRRLDIDIGVAYKEDVEHVKQTLLEVARRNPLCLDEPEPILLFTNFGDSALEFLFGVWFKKEDFFLLRCSIMQEIKERFDAEGIEIPFPHRTLYTGSATEPFPVRVVADPREGNDHGEGESEARRA